VTLIDLPLFDGSFPFFFVILSSCPLLYFVDQFFEHIFSPVARFESGMITREGYGPFY